MASAPKLSIVIPVYNEEQVLDTLFERLYPALDKLGLSYECVFVNDGSKDRSAAMLRRQFQRRPRETRVVLFHANFGQHSAVMAGLAYARGEYVITLDADLQNPPEEIGKLVEMLEKGYDYVGTIRIQRQDSLWRRWLSKGVNKLREWITPVRITDQGCMMRGYSRLIVEALKETREVNTFIPALASLYAMNPIEVPIAHEERHAGKSKYSLYSLIRLNFDLITGFSVVPLQLFSMVGMAMSALSAILVIVLFVRRLIIGSEAEGLFTLFGLVFFFIGLALFGIGLLGEYVGRIYAQVRERPRYLIEAVLEEGGGEGHPRGPAPRLAGVETQPADGAIADAAPGARQ
ncbi:MAG: glycosyltransferase [Steroidobacteraceae bacterium]|jgi:undecaprenyl-phosphate 4-deoxy-4-formamido-L-arabinose transferase